MPPRRTGVASAGLVVTVTLSCAIALVPAAQSRVAAGVEDRVDATVIARSQLPGGRWTTPSRIEEVGRIGALLTVPDAPCALPTPVKPVPLTAAGSMFARRGYGLSFVASAAATYRSRAQADRIFETALSPGVVRCIVRSLVAGGVPSSTSRLDFSGFGDRSLAYRIAMRYQPKVGTPWRGNVDLVNIRVGRAWALLAFFSTEPARPEAFERALVGATVTDLKLIPGGAPPARREASLATFGGECRIALVNRSSYPVDDQASAREAPAVAPLATAVRGMSRCSGTTTLESLGGTVTIRITGSTLSCSATGALTCRVLPGHSGKMAAMMCGGGYPRVDIGGDAVVESPYHGVSGPSHAEIASPTVDEPTRVFAGATRAAGPNLRGEC